MTELPLVVAPSGERRCLCVAGHIPQPRELHRHHVWPLGEGGPNTAANLRWLCPTSHSSAHRLWREYQKRRTTPPWDARRVYGKYVRDLVAQGWAMAHPDLTGPVGTSHDVPGEVQQPGSE